MSEQKKILVVDDSKTIRCLVTRLLEGEGFKVIAPECSEMDAGFITDVIKTATDENVNMIICDLTLPGKDGKMSVSNGLNLIKDFRDLPIGAYVIALSGTVDQAALTEVRKFGADGVVSKVDPDVLTILKKKVLELAARNRREME